MSLKFWRPSPHPGFAPSPFARERKYARLVGDLDDPERGDVPGWVMVTLMTAGLVAALWLVAKPALVGLFEQAMNAININ